TVSAVTSTARVSRVAFLVMVSPRRASHIRAPHAYFSPLNYVTLHYANSVLRTPHSALRTPDSALRTFVLLRPIRLLIVPVFRDLPDVLPVAIDQKHLRLARTRRRKREVAAVRRPGRALVAAFAERDLSRLPGGKVEDLD